MPVLLLLGLYTKEVVNNSNPKQSPIRTRARTIQYVPELVLYGYSYDRTMSKMKKKSCVGDKSIKDYLTNQKSFELGLLLGQTGTLANYFLTWIPIPYEDGGWRHSYEDNLYFKSKHLIWCTFPHIRKSSSCEIARYLTRVAHYPCFTGRLGPIVYHNGSWLYVYVECTQVRTSLAGGIHIIGLYIISPHESRKTLAQCAPIVSGLLFDQIWKCYK